MTHHLTNDICRRLRDAGLPQPEIEYLLQYLPNEITISRDSHGKWYIGFVKLDGLKITGFDIIAEAYNLLHAAALAYLHIHEKTPAS